MEEIYIIKLKGLPTSSEESLRDNKASFYYRKDLTGEALLGFGLFHSFIGAALITLSIINLTLSGEQNSEQIGSGIWCGAIFVISGLTGVMTSQKRKSDISKSKIQVKIFFAMTITSLLLTIAFITLFIFGIRESAANHFLTGNMLIAFMIEFFISLLSIFTCVRVIWPSAFPCCAKDWPGHPKLKRKVIVSTQIYTNGVHQDEDLIRNLGPNCVISLSPPNGYIERGDNYLITNSEPASSCPCCDTCRDYVHANNKYVQNGECHHNSGSSSSNECDHHEDYYNESEFDTFDSTLDQGNGDEGREQMMDVVIEEEVIEAGESKYQVIHQSDNRITRSCQNAACDSVNSVIKVNHYDGHEQKQCDQCSEQCETSA